MSSLMWTVAIVLGIGFYVGAAIMVGMLAGAIHHGEYSNRFIQWLMFPIQQFYRRDCDSMRGCQYHLGNEQERSYFSAWSGVLWPLRLAFNLMCLLFPLITIAFIADMAARIAAPVVAWWRSGRVDKAAKQRVQADADALPDRPTNDMSIDRLIALRDRHRSNMRTSQEAASAYNEAIKEHYQRTRIALETAATIDEELAAIVLDEEVRNFDARLNSSKTP